MKLSVLLPETCLFKLFVKLFYQTVLPQKLFYQTVCSSARDRAEDVQDLSYDGTSVGDISNDFEGRPDVANGDSLDDKDRSLLDKLVLQSADKQIEENMFVVQHGDARSEEMDRVLEHQAQLIGLYEEEENAQREWEEKYHENTNVFVVCAIYFVIFVA